MKRDSLNFIDLFAGAGGLSEGFMQKGFNPIAHVEMNQYATMTLETRSIYYYLKKVRRLNIYYDYLRGDITRAQLLEAVPAEILQTVICEEMSAKTIANIFEQIDLIMEQDGVNHVDVVVGGPPCQGVYVNLYVNDAQKHQDVIERLNTYASKFIKIFSYNQQSDDKMSALHAKLIVVDRHTSLISSANLSYHGMQGNVEMGVLIESAEKAQEIESLLRTLREQKVFLKCKQ